MRLNVCDAHKGGCDSHCEMEDYPIDIIEHLPNTNPRARYGQYKHFQCS
jgi:hypothetical protein